jgi:hypothetical protein
LQGFCVFSHVFFSFLPSFFLSPKQTNKENKLQVPGNFLIDQSTFRRVFSWLSSFFFFFLLPLFRGHKQWYSSSSPAPLLLPPYSILFLFLYLSDLDLDVFKKY